MNCRSGVTSRAMLKQHIARIGEVDHQSEVLDGIQTLAFATNKALLTRAKPTWPNNRLK